MIHHGWSSCWEQLPALSWQGCAPTPCDDKALFFILLTVNCVLAKAEVLVVTGFSCTNQIMGQALAGGIQWIPPLIRISAFG